jgi:hypothetical protein
MAGFPSITEDIEMANYVNNIGKACHINAILLSINSMLQPLSCPPIGGWVSATDALIYISGMVHGAGIVAFDADIAGL